MYFQSSAILSLAAVPFFRVEACPFASSGLTAKIQRLPKFHRSIGPARSSETLHRQLDEEESLIGLDGRLVGSPSLDNGAMDFPSILVPIQFGGTATIADIVADMSAATGEDFCLIRFQQLPPPKVGNYSFDQDATDRQSLLDFADLMVQRFSDLSDPSLHMGAIVHASTTIGYGGIESMCNAGIQSERFCSDIISSALRWPQAVTGYKLTNETVDVVKAAIETWRTTDDGHLPSMTWSWSGGNPEVGGSQVGYWGGAGGLFSKIVKCDDIPPELLFYEYPNDVATTDYVDPTTNKTVSDMMYEWWVSYGGYDPSTGEKVFGEAPKLPEICRPCIEARPCFEGRGCNLLDLESETWADPFADCGPSIACKDCFPECIADKMAESNANGTDSTLTELCGPCSEAKPCFEEGCNFLDLDSETWADPYAACGPAIACKDCFPECIADKMAESNANGTDSTLTELCGPCSEAKPCFEEGCNFFDLDSETWADPYAACGPAIACKDCFPECIADKMAESNANGTDSTLTELCGPCSEAKPCFEEGCNFFDLDSETWADPYADCGPAIACKDCFPECIAQKEAEADAMDASVADADETDAPGDASDTSGAMWFTLPIVAMTVLAGLMQSLYFCS